MNIPFMNRNRNVPQLVGHAVDLDEEMRLTVAGRLPQAPQFPVSDFAPRRQVPRVESFLELPLKEIDAAMKSLEVGYEQTRARGQHLRDLIMAAHEELLDNIKRERAFAEFTVEAFDALQRKYAEIDKPEPTETVAALDAPKDEQTGESVP